MHFRLKLFEGLYMAGVFLSVLSIFFMIKWVIPRRKTWKSRQARGVVRVPTRYTPTGIAGGTRQATATIVEALPTTEHQEVMRETDTTTKALQMAVSVTEHGEVVMGSPYLHVNTPLVTRQSFLTPRADGLVSVNSSNFITPGGRTVNISLTGAQATHVCEQSEYSETELSEIAPFLCQSTSNHVNEDGTSVATPSPVYNAHLNPGSQQSLALGQRTHSQRICGFPRSPGTPRSVVHGDVTRPVFTNKRMVSEAVTLNGDAEELEPGHYDADPHRTYGYLRSPRPGSPRSPRTVTHGDAVRPVFLNRRMVSEAVTLSDDAEEVELGCYGEMGMRGGGEEETAEVEKVEKEDVVVGDKEHVVVKEEEETLVNEEPFDPSQFPPLREWVVKVSKEMTVEEERKERWATAIEEAKEVVLRGWPTWESYQRYLDWAFKDEKARERMLDGWRECVLEAGRGLVEKHIRENVDQVSITEQAVDGDPTVAPRGTVLEAALLMKSSCRKLHHSLEEMCANMVAPDVVPDTSLYASIRRLPVVVDRLEDNLVPLIYNWIGPRELKLMDGIDKWVAENKKQEVVFRMLKGWKEATRGKRMFWSPLWRRFKEDGMEEVIEEMVDKRPFFGGTLETYAMPIAEEEQWCRATGRDRTTMRIWMAMSSTRGNGSKVDFDQREVNHFYGMGEDVTDKVKRPSDSVPTIKPKTKPVPFDSAQATYLRNKAGLDEAELAMKTRDAEFMRFYLTHDHDVARKIVKLVPNIKTIVDRVTELELYVDGSRIFNKSGNTCIYQATAEGVDPEFWDSQRQKLVGIRGGLLEEGEKEKKDDVQVLVDELAEMSIGGADVSDDAETDSDIDSDDELIYRDRLHYALSFLDDDILNRLPLFEMHDARFSLTELHEVEKLLHGAANKEFWQEKRRLRAECEYFLLSGKLCLDDEEEEDKKEEEYHAEATVDEFTLSISNSSPLNWFPWLGVQESELDSELESDSDATIDQAELLTLPDSDSDSDLHDHTYGIPDPNPSIPICSPLNWFPWFKTHTVASSIIEAEKLFGDETEADARAAVKRLLDVASNARGRPSMNGHLKKHPDLEVWQCQNHSKACGECSMLPSSSISSESVGRRARREMSLLKLQMLSRKNMGCMRTAMALQDVEKAMDATAYEDYADHDVQALWNDAAYLWMTGTLPIRTLMTDREVDSGPCGPGMIIPRLRLMLIDLEERGEIIAAFNREHPNDVMDQEEVYQIQLQVTKISIALLGIEAKMSMDELQETLMGTLDLGATDEEVREDKEQNIHRQTLRGGYLEDEEEEEEKEEAVVLIEDLSSLTSSAPLHLDHDASSDHSTPESASSSTSPFSSPSVSSVRPSATTTTTIHTHALFGSFQNLDGTWQTSEGLPILAAWKEWTHWQELQLNAGHLWDVADFFQNPSEWRQFVINTAKGNFAARPVPRNRCVSSAFIIEDEEEDQEKISLGSQSSHDVLPTLRYARQHFGPKSVAREDAQHVGDQISSTSIWARHIESADSDDPDWNEDEKTMRSHLEVYLALVEIERAMRTTAKQQLSEKRGRLESTHPKKDRHRTAVRLQQSHPYARTPRIPSHMHKETTRFIMTPGVENPLLQQRYATRPLSPIPEEGIRCEHLDPFRLAYGHPSIRSTLSRSKASVRVGGVESSSIVDSGSHFGKDVAYAAFQFIYNLEDPVPQFAFHNTSRGPSKPMLPNEFKYGSGMTRVSSAYCKGVEKRREERRKGIVRANWVRENPELWWGEKWIFPEQTEVYWRSDRAGKLVGLRAFWDKDPREMRYRHRVDRRDEVVRKRIGQRNGTIRPFLHKRVMGRSQWSSGQRRVRDMRKEDLRADVFAGSLRVGALESWECQVCRDLFTTSNALELHRRTHIGQAPFIRQGFNSVQDMGSHSGTPTGENPLIPRRNDYGDKAAQAAQVLLTIHTSPRNLGKDTTNRGLNDRHQCTTCREWFTKVEHLGENWMGHLREDSMRDFGIQADNGDALGPYRCLFSDAEFSTPQSLTLHKQTHTQKNLFKSQELDCGYEGAQSSQLSKQTRTTYTKENPLDSSESGGEGRSEFFACKWQDHPILCPWGLPCSSKADLQAHIESTHTALLTKSSGDYICRWSGCDRPSLPSASSRFIQRSKLERRMQTHTGFKASRCLRCNREFADSKSLEAHMRAHTGERPFECDVPECHYAAAQASQLTMHQRTKHTKEMPLVCSKPGCGMKFPESINLAKHRKIHEPEENTKCDVCCKGFKRRDGLRRHIKIHLRKDARYEDRDDVMDMDDMARLPSPPPPTPDQGLQSPPETPNLSEALPAPQQRVGTPLTIRSSYLGGRGEEQHAERCRPERCAPGCTSTTPFPDHSERPRGGALSLDGEAYPWGRHTVYCRADYCVIGCRSILTLPHEKFEFRVDKEVLESSTFPSKLILPHPLNVLSMTPWAQGLAERPVRIPDWELTVPENGEGLRDGDLAMKTEANTPPLSGPRGYGNHGSRGQSPAYSSNNGRASSRNEGRCASIKREKSPLLPTSAAHLGLGATEGETNGGKRRQDDDSEGLRGGALDDRAEALKSETKLAPWGCHAEECQAQGCADDCRSILSLPHDRFAFGVNTARLATSLPNDRTARPLVPQHRQASAPTTQTEAVTPRPIPISHSLTRAENEESELSELSEDPEEPEGLRGGDLNDDKDGPFGPHTEWCCAGHCVMGCSSILNLPHESGELSVAKALTEISAPVTETQAELVLMTLDHRWGQHRRGCYPGYCARGCTAIPNLLNILGDNSQVDRDSVGLWKYLFERDVVPSLNSFATMRSEMLGQGDGDEESREEECGGALTLSSSAPAALPTQVPTQIPLSKEAISERQGRDGGRFAFKRDYARKESEFPNPWDQLPSWRLGPWIGHDMSCRRSRCALVCRATTTLESIASWSWGKDFAPEMWVVDPVTSEHGDGILAKALEECRLASVSEEAVAGDGTTIEPVLQALAAAFSTTVQPSDIMLKKPIVMEEVLRTPSSNGSLRGGALQCTKKKAGWVIDERLRFRFQPAIPNTTQRPERDMPDSPPLTPPLGAPQNQVNTAKRLSIFIPLLPPSPPQSRNNSPAKVDASQPFNPYLVWPSDAPFLPPLKGYWSPEYDKSGFWRRPVCPDELHKRLSFLPETGRFRWCGDGETIERVETLQEIEEADAEMGLRGGGIKDAEDLEWVEDSDSSADTVDDESTYETPDSPPQSPPDEGCKESEYPLMPLLKGLWPGWVNDDEEETPVLQSPRKRTFDEMLGQMDIGDVKETAVVTEHHLEEDAVDSPYFEIVEPPCKVHIADLNKSWDVADENDEPPSTSSLSIRTPHQPTTPVYSPELSAPSSSSTFSNEDNENRCMYVAVPRRLAELVVYGKDTRFSRTLMYRGTGLLMLHRDCEAPESMRYMQDAYAWRQHFDEERVREVRVREKTRRSGIELDWSSDRAKNPLVLSQVIQLKPRNDEDISFMAFKPRESLNDRERLRDRRVCTRNEELTRLVRQQFIQRCQWRFTWEEWNEMERVVERSLDEKEDGYTPDSDEEGGYVVFEDESMRGGYGVLRKRQRKSRWGERRKRFKKRRERKMMYSYAAIREEKKEARRMDFS